MTRVDFLWATFAGLSYLLTPLVSGKVFVHPHTATYVRPDHTHHARMARWLVTENDWGVVSTTSQHLSGIAFGNLLSFSDGPRGNSTGRLLFYLTPLDATAIDLMENKCATLTIGEIQLAGSCIVVDPEDPTCAKVSLSGAMGRVPEESLHEARELLFSRHPQMRGWPKGHNFDVYELDIVAIRLLDFYGGAAEVSRKGYFAAELEPAARKGDVSHQMLVQ